MESDIAIKYLKLLPNSLCNDRVGTLFYILLDDYDSKKRLISDIGLLFMSSNNFH